MNIDWNKHLKEVLDRTQFMALSTVGDDGLWTCALQFAYSEKCVMYVKSPPSTRHMQHIVKNPNVSFAIYSTNRFPVAGKVAGVQGRGRAKILTERHDVTRAARYHYVRGKPDVNPEDRIDEHLGENPVWRFVEIIPSELWCLDTRIFDEVSQGRQRILIDDLDLKITPFLYGQ